MKKRFMFSVVLLLTTIGVFAQDNGLSGITQATTMVTSYFDPAV